MLTDPGLVTVVLQKNTPTSNGAGGNIESWADVGTYSARLRNRKPAPFTYAEQGAGLLKRTEKFLIFDQPVTIPITDDVRNFRFSINGEYWSVRHPDVYKFTVQVDVERVP